MARRVLLYGVLVITALLLQVSVVDLLPLPGSRPDLVLVVVVACALASGPLGGSITGFSAGLLSDLMPPAVHTVGRLALAYALVGYLAGILEDVEERSVVVPMLVVGAATVGATVLYAGVGALTGDSRVTGSAFLTSLPTAVLYGVALTPFVVPLVTFLDRRLEPAEARR